MLLFLKHRAYFYQLLLKFQIYKILAIFFRNQNSFQSNILDFQIIALRRVIRGKRFQKRFFLMVLHLKIRRNNNSNFYAKPAHKVVFETLLCMSL